jgi:hypothetical protein
MSTTSSSRAIESLQTLDTNPSLVKSLKSLGAVYGENSVDGRRGLRGEIERHSLQNSKDVLAALQEIEKVFFFSFFGVFSSSLVFFSPIHFLSSFWST